MNKNPIVFYKTLVIGVIVLFFSMSVVSSNGIIYEKESPSEIIIDGPAYGIVGEQLFFCFLLTDQEGCYEILYYADWGDGNNSGWSPPVPSETWLCFSHAWGNVGIYCITVNAKDCEGFFYQAAFNITIHYPPDAPTISGPARGNLHIELEYAFVANDPENENISYYIEWGDGETTGWTEYYPSGEDITVNHTWSEKRNYTIRAMAIDTYGAESDWSEFEIIIPRKRATFNPLFYLLMERLPLLERLLNMIR
jgi:hypothetical protein